MTPPLPARLATILLVEDNPADAELTRIAFESAKVKVNLVHVWDGVEALDYLRRQGEFADAGPVDLVLLDLNMPRLDGHQVLKAARADEALQSLPIVVMTTSGEATDVKAAYREHANCYVQKPVGLGALTKIVTEIEHFWFHIVCLPTR